MQVQRKILNAIDMVCVNIFTFVQDTSSKEIALSRLQQTRNWVERMNETKVSISLDKIANRIYHLRNYKLPKDTETLRLQSLLLPLEITIKNAVQKTWVNNVYPIPT